ncbi:hypothetical protein [Marinomonas primoryensis]|uniref:YcaO domain-containing protein n=1 Tax=Marinomonas primoryensis TaxID=178399 RepID=A0ABV0L530_9GAMM
MSEMESYPLSSKLYSCIRYKEYFISKTALGVKKNGIDKYIFGFGCSRSKSVAHTSSRFECVEHYLGSIMAESLYDNDGFIARDINKKNKGFIIPKDQVLVGSIQSESNMKINATGLAIERNYFRSCEHALFELIERHISYLWWFEALNFLNVENIIKKDNAEEYNLTWGCQENNLWYSIYIILNFNGNTVSIGSCLKNKKDESIEHSKCEAIMIDQSHENTVNNVRYEKIKGEKLVFEVKKRINQAFMVKYNNEVSEICMRILNESFYTILVENEDFCVVRAFSKNVKDATNRYENENTPFL